MYYIYTSTAPSILLPVVRGSSIQNAGKFRVRVFVYMYNNRINNSEKHYRFALLYFCESSGLCVAL